MMGRGHHDQLLARGWRVTGVRQSKYEFSDGLMRLEIWRGWPAGWHWVASAEGRRLRCGAGCATRLAAAKEARAALEHARVAG